MPCHGRSIEQAETDMRKMGGAVEVLPIFFVHNRTLSFCTRVECEMVK